jgi:dTDP-4-dehydrorhamnose 3,5-epimerase
MKAYLMYGKWLGFTLSDTNKKQIWMPPAIAHGFLVLSKSAQFIYKTTDCYHPSSEV